MKFYAVKKGKKTGIFTTWDETEKLVKGYSGAQYKSFKTREEAVDYLGGEVGHGTDQKLTRKRATKKRPAKKPTKPDSFSGETIVYTDGGSRNHGKVRGGHVKASDKAAWAFLVQTKDGQFAKSDGEFGATNNRMEIMAFLEALKYLAHNHLQNSRIDVVMDSRYVLDAIQKGWLKGWRNRGWTKSDGSKLQNKELWQAVDQQLREFQLIQYHWTKGHAADAGNVFVDELLNKTMDKMGTSQAQTPQLVEKLPPIQQLVKQQKEPKTTDHKIDLPKPGPKTATSVRDIENSLKQLGLFDEDDD